MRFPGADADGFPAAEDTTSVSRQGGLEGSPACRIALISPRTLARLSRFSPIPVRSPFRPRCPPRCVPAMRSVSGGSKRSRQRDRGGKLARSVPSRRPFIGVENFALELANSGECGDAKRAAQARSRPKCDKGIKTRSMNVRKLCRNIEPMRNTERNNPQSPSSTCGRVAEGACGAGDGAAAGDKIRAPSQPLSRKRGRAGKATGIWL
jgi:hypothetical protein